jgi:hypothetical protein
LSGAGDLRLRQGLEGVVAVLAQQPYGGAGVAAGDRGHDRPVLGVDVEAVLRGWRIQGPVPVGLE